MHGKTIPEEEEICTTDEEISIEIPFSVQIQEISDQESETSVWKDEGERMEDETE